MLKQQVKTELDASQVEHLTSRIGDLYDLSGQSFTHYHYLVAKICARWVLAGREDDFRTLITFEDINHLALLNEHLRDLDKILHWPDDETDTNQE